MSASDLGIPFSKQTAFSITKLRSRKDINFTEFKKIPTHCNEVPTSEKKCKTNNICLGKKQKKLQIDFNRILFKILIYKSVTLPI